MNHLIAAIVMEARYQQYLRHGNRFDRHSFGVFFVIPELERYYSPRADDSMAHSCELCAR